MRFIKQRDKYSCGAIALMNTLKWLGHKSGLTYKDLPLWRCLCKTSLINGTSARDLLFAFKDLSRLSKKASGLRGYNFKVRSIKNAKLKEIDLSIDAGRAVVIATTVPTGWHWILIIGRTNKTYKIINYNSGPTIQNIRRCVIDLSMRKARNNRDKYPYAIIISKQKHKVNTPMWHGGKTGLGTV